VIQNRFVAGIQRKNQIILNVNSMLTNHINNI